MYETRSETGYIRKGENANTKSPPERVDMRLVCNKSNAFDWEMWGRSVCSKAVIPLLLSRPFRCTQTISANYRPFSEKKQPLTEKKHPHKVNPPFQTGSLFFLAREPNWIMQARYRFFSK